MNAQTLTGYPVELIPQLMDAIYPAAAYKAIAGGVGASRGWSDLDPDMVRERLDMVFGVHGFGWRIMPAPGIGTTVHFEKDKANGKGKTQVIALETWQFEYRVELSNGQVEWLIASAIGGADENDELTYAYRGAFTNTMKHAVKNFGGFVHMTSDVYDHEKAKQGDHKDAWYAGTLGKVGALLAKDYALERGLSVAELRQALKLANGVSGDKFPGDLNAAKRAIDKFIADPPEDVIDARQGELDPEPPPEKPASEPDAGVPPELQGAQGLKASPFNPPAAARAIESAFTSFWQQNIVKGKRANATKPRANEGFTADRMPALFGAGYRTERDWNNPQFVVEALAKIDEHIKAKLAEAAHPGAVFSKPKTAEKADGVRA